MKTPFPARAIQLAVVIAAGAACTDEPTPPATTRAPVINGTDDRQDYFEATDPAFAELIERSTVALVDPRYIHVSDPEDVVPNTVTLGEYKRLCPDERFADQPAMASCSGTLIDDDLVLTASHCVDAEVCADWYLVFGFFMAAPGQLNHITAADVYTCAEIIVDEYTQSASEDTWHDYAIVRLDRAVDSRRTPARIALDASAVQVGDSLTALGFGNGIPAKVHAGGVVLRSIESWGYFVGSTDTFSANSGSGTYNDDHELVGVFVRGGDADYRETDEGCATVNVVAESEATQEYDFANKIVSDLCQRGYSSSRLCGSDEPSEPEGAEPTDTVEPTPGASGGCRVGGPASWLALLALAALAARRRIGLNG